MSFIRFSRAALFLVFHSGFFHGFWIGSCFSWFKSQHIFDQVFQGNFSRVFYFFFFFTGFQGSAFLSCVVLSLFLAVLVRFLGSFFFFFLEDFLGFLVFLNLVYEQIILQAA